MRNPLLSHAVEPATNLRRRRSRSVWANSLICACVVASAACSAAPPRDANEANDPFALVRTADRLAAEGDVDEATRKYLLALDEGRQRDSAFGAARGEVVRKLAAIGERYPPARAALAERCHSLSPSVSFPAHGLDGRDVRLFVVVCRSSGNEPEVLSAYTAAKTRLPRDSRVRIWLGGAIGEYLVEERRYAEALAATGTEVVDYYLDLFRSSRDNEQVRPAIEITIANQCGAHYEALLGAGRRGEADAFAERLIDYAPTSKTLGALIERARRARALDAEARLRARAQELGLAPAKDSAGVP